MVLLCHSVNETGHPIVHSSKLRWNSFGFEARESRHLHEAATCQSFLDVGGWLVGPPSPQNHCIAMQAIPKTWCMLKIRPLGNPWHLLLSVQVSKCCELPAQQRCINHHLGITKNSNNKELHWEQSTQSMTKDMMKYICYILLLYLHDSLPVTLHKM